MWWNTTLHFISGFLKAKAIRGPNEEPYLERYLVARVGAHAIFLHRFLASDPDRGLHDHPWSRSVSLLICGGYIEKRLMSKAGKLWMIVRRRNAGQFNVIRGDDFHQLVLEPGRPAWSLFYHGPRIKIWGFAVADRSKTNEPGEYDVQHFEPYEDSKPEAPWEREAPRGRNLAARVPVDYRLRTR